MGKKSERREQRTAAAIEAGRKPMRQRPQAGPIIRRLTSDKQGDTRVRATPPPALKRKHRLRIRRQERQKAGAPAV